MVTHLTGDPYPLRLQQVSHHYIKIRQNRGKFFSTKICLILEGSYPYVHGGVLLDAYYRNEKEHEFVSLGCGATHEQKGEL